MVGPRLIGRTVAHHGRHVDRISRLLVLGLLELPAVDQLNVGDGYCSGFAGVRVGEATAQRGQHVRPVVVERLGRPLSDV